jgi:N-acetylmuramoyl-L-alanine amidase
VGIPTLFLAAGHGDEDRGAKADGLREADLLIAFVGGMREARAACGAPARLGGVVFLDDALDLAGELQALKAWKPTAQDRDLCIDFHLDFKPGTSGALVLYDEQPVSKRFAKLWQQRWCALTGIKDNGIHPAKASARAWRGWDDYGWTRPDWPGCIVELGCVNSAFDRMRIAQRVVRTSAMALAWQCYREARG